MRDLRMSIDLSRTRKTKVPQSLRFKLKSSPTSKQLLNDKIVLFMTPIIASKIVKCFFQNHYLKRKELLNSTDYVFYVWTLTI